MSKVSINELRDFCNMVCDYMALEEESNSYLNPLQGYAINYGEITWWGKKHHRMCADCMAGGNELANTADDLTHALYEFKMFLDLEKEDADKKN